MLTLVKFLFRMICIGAIALFGAGLLQTAPQASSEFTTSRVEFAIRTAAIEVPAQVRAFSVDADSFVSRHATTARFEFESLSNSMSSSLTLDSWLPADACNWIESGIQKATTTAVN